jgi:hypothetical protein
VGEAGSLPVEGGLGAVDLLQVMPVQSFLMGLLTDIPANHFVGREFLVG